MSNNKQRKISKVAGLTAVLVLDRLYGEFEAHHQHSRIDRLAGRDADEGRAPMGV